MKFRYVRIPSHDAMHVDAKPSIVKKEKLRCRRQLLHWPQRMDRTVPSRPVSSPTRSFHVCLQLCHGIFREQCWFSHQTLVTRRMPMWRMYLCRDAMSPLRSQYLCKSDQTTKAKQSRSDRVEKHMGTSSEVIVRSRAGQEPWSYRHTSATTVPISYRHPTFGKQRRLSIHGVADQHGKPWVQSG